MLKGQEARNVYQLIRMGCARTEALFMHCSNVTPRGVNICVNLIARPALCL